jgi:hypothetical protein
MRKKRVLIDFAVGLLVGSFLAATISVSCLLYDQQMSRFKMQDAEERARQAEIRAKMAREEANASIKKAEDAARIAEHATREAENAKLKPMLPRR